MERGLLFWVVSNEKEMGIKHINISKNEIVRKKLNSKFKFIINISYKMWSEFRSVLPYINISVLSTT